MLYCFMQRIIPHGRFFSDYTLERGGQTLKAAQVSADEMKGHRDFIDAARGELRKFANLRNTPPAEGDEIPTMK